MKVCTHIQPLFGPKFFYESNIHILPNYEQMDLKTAIVNFLKLQILASCNKLSIEQDSEFDKF